MSDAKAWYLVAAPETIDGLEYAYLSGEEGPQTFSEIGFDVDWHQVQDPRRLWRGLGRAKGYWKQPGA